MADQENDHTQEESAAADQQSDSKSERLRISVETRALEINLFWQRSLFFWGFTIAAGAGFLETYTKGSGIALVISCFGMVCTFAWSLVNRGSKYWQENWENKAEAAAVDVLGGSLFGNPAPIHSRRLLGAKRFSVSHLTTALSDFVFVGWFFAVIYQLWLILTSDQPHWATSDWLRIAFGVFSIIYLGYMFFSAKRFEVSTVRIYKDRKAAEIDRDALQAAGVQAQLQDVHTFRHRIILTVMKRDLQCAEELLGRDSKPAGLIDKGVSPYHDGGEGVENAGCAHARSTTDGGPDVV